MASERNENAGEPPRLYFYLDGGAPDLRQTGLILDRLANAFRTHSQLISVGRPGSLVLDEIGTGTLFAFFKAIFETGSAALTLYEHREFLSGFVTQFIEGLKLIQAGGGQAPLPAFRMAIETMSAPIRSGRATHLKLQVEGDNNQIFVIDANSAADVQIFLNSQPRPARGRVDDIHLAAQGISAPSRGGAMDSRARPLAEKSRQVAEEMERLLSAGSGAPSTKRALPRGQMGTLLSLGGRWLVRPEGYMGALFPADFRTVDAASLDPSLEYFVRGEVVPGGYSIASILSPRG